MVWFRMSSDVLDSYEDWDVYRIDVRFVEDVNVVRLVKKLWRRNILVMQLHVKSGNVE